MSVGILINSVVLSGNVGKDPDVRNNPNGSIIARVSLATDDSYKDRKTGKKVENTNWHTLVAWGELAKSIEKVVQKGTNITIHGKLMNNNWTDDKGVKHFDNVIQIDEYKIHGGGKARPAISGSSDDEWR
jgi:single-strand DNA-binding protein